MSVIWYKVWFDLWNNKVRTALAVFSIAAGVFAIGAIFGIGLMGSLSISIVERTHEIGVMRAIGARSRTIMGMFMLEAVLQGIFSWLIAVPISIVAAASLSQILGQAMFDANLDYQYD